MNIGLLHMLAAVSAARPREFDHIGGACSPIVVPKCRAGAGDLPAATIVHDFLPMMKLKAAAPPPLPPFDGVVCDLVTCERWLGEARLAEPLQACAEFARLRDQLEGNGLDPNTHAVILERLRRRMLLALEEASKRFVGRAVPLREAEAAAFDTVCALWSRYADSMQRLAQRATPLPQPALAAGSVAGAVPPEPPIPAVLVMGRAIEALSGLARAHFQARRELDERVWPRLHALFIAAESRGLLDTPIHADNPHSPTCRELYLRMALTFVASPSSLTARELDWAWRWTSRWAHKVQIVTTHDRDGFFGVDLASAQPPRWLSGVRGAHVRRFDLSELRRSLRKRIKGIEAGQSPHALGLGQDIQAPEALALLWQLHVRWFESPVSRHAPRHAAPRDMTIALGFEEIYNAIGGTRPIGPKHAWGESGGARDRIFALGKLSDATSTCVFEPRLEIWQQLDFSTSGLRMRRMNAGDRVAFRQLAAVCESTGGGFALAEVRWITEGVDQSVTAALQHMPGAPRPIGIRGAPEAGPARGPFHAAFMLPEAAGQPASLVLPFAVVKAESVLEIQHLDELFTVRLGKCVARGADYERFTFDRLEPIPVE